jgi:hypothetical protein
VQAQGNNAKAPDLKNVIPYVKRKVLQGTNLVREQQKPVLGIELDIVC